MVPKCPTHAVVWVKEQQKLVPGWSVLLSHFEHGGLLLTDEHADVGVTQVCAVDLFVSASRVDVSEGLIDLQGPNPFVVHPVGGDAPLLAERPQADGPVWTARQALWRQVLILELICLTATTAVGFRISHLSAISI